MRDRFLKVMVMAGYFSVALFCLFSLCSFSRLVWVLPILAVFFIIREKQDAICRVMGCFGAWMQKHKCLILGVVVIMAVLVRVLFYLFAISDLDAFQNSDSRVFVARARELLCGEFPNVKSWVTCGIHALRIGILGDSTWGIPIVNFLFQVLGARVMFVALERPFGRIVAFCASMLYLFHPSSILLTFRALSEPIFFVLLFSALYFLYELILDKKIKSAIMFTVMAWLSIWTRGEGLLLFGVFCVCALVGGGFLRGARVGAVFAEIGGSVFVLSLFFAVGLSPVFEP